MRCSLSLPTFAVVCLPSNLAHRATSSIVSPTSSFFPLVVVVLPAVFTVICECFQQSLSSTYSVSLLPLTHKLLAVTTPAMHARPRHIFHLRFMAHLRPIAVIIVVSGRLSLGSSCFQRLSFPSTHRLLHAETTHRTASVRRTEISFSARPTKKRFPCLLPRRHLHYPHRLLLHCRPHPLFFFRPRRPSRRRLSTGLCLGVTLAA